MALFVLFYEVKNMAGNASTRAKNKYAANNYDNLRIIVPKGGKEVIKEAAKQNRVIYDTCDFDNLVSFGRPPIALKCETRLDIAVITYASYVPTIRKFFTFGGITIKHKAVIN